MELFVRARFRSVSDKYEINWEHWSEKETIRLTTELSRALPIYEQMFTDFKNDIYDEGEDVDTEENAERLADILENLVSGYIIQSLLHRKREVEDLLSSI